MIEDYLVKYSEDVKPLIGSVGVLKGCR
jgi:hypothetical protein